MLCAVVLCSSPVGIRIVLIKLRTCDHSIRVVNYYARDTSGFVQWLGKPFSLHRWLPDKSKCVVHVMPDNLFEHLLAVTCRICEYKSECVAE